LTSTPPAARIRMNTEQLQKAAWILKRGGLVVYPTESSYALGASALDESAIQKVYDAKGRGFRKPIPVIVADLHMWSKYAHLGREAKLLISAFMPGPLTVVLKKRKLIPDILTPTSLAARIPGHPVARKLVKDVGFPITSTSANLSGQPPAFSVQHLKEPLRSSVDLLLDVGRLPRGRPSTIVDLTNPIEPQIVREGPISKSQVFAVLNAGRRA